MAIKTKLLVVKLGTTPETRPIIDLLRARLAPCFIAGVEECLDTPDSVYDEILTSHDDALFGAYLKHDLSRSFIDGDLAKEMKEFEGQGLRMLDRLVYHEQSLYKKNPLFELRYRGSFRDRVDLLSRHTIFWDYVLRKYQFDAVISQNFSHVGYDLPLEHLCRLRRIPHLILADVPKFAPGTIYIQESVGDFGNLAFGKSIKDRCSSNLFPETRKWISRRYLSVHSENLRNHEVQKSLVRRSFNTGILTALITRGSIHREVNSVRDVLNSLGSRTRAAVVSPLLTAKSLLRTTRRSVRTRQSMNEERSLSSMSPPIGPYVYFPLHFQPEASTSSKGRHYVEQREAVAMVAASLPPGWRLLVKEHPHQFRRLYPRPRNFYKSLTNIPNTALIHHTFPGESLVDSSEGVVAISHASSAISAWLKGRRVVILGDSNLLGAPRILFPQHVHELKQFWLNEWNHNVDSTVLLRYLEEVEASTFELGFHGAPSGYSSEEAKTFVLRTQHNTVELILAWLASRNVKTPTETD